MTRFQEAFEQYEKHWLEAGELLGDVRSQVSSAVHADEEDGIEGLRDRRIGKASPRFSPGTGSRALPN